jgi:hypothetical protein
MIIGLTCGAFAGFILGFVVAYAAGVLSAWATPDDPSAGSIVIITAPGGAVLEAALGAFVGALLPIKNSPQ